LFLLPFLLLLPLPLLFPPSSPPPPRSKTAEGAPKDPTLHLTRAPRSPEAPEAEAESTTVVVVARSQSPRSSRLPAGATAFLGNE
jgi:hypothetical protein